MPTDFETRYKQNPDDPGGEQIAVDWVTWVRIGDRSGSRNSEAINRLKPKNHGDKPSAMWLVIEPHYEAWKAGEKLAEVGTPLEGWPAATKPLIQALKGVNVRSVEDFALCPDSTLSKLPVPQMTELKKAALRFIDVKANASDFELLLAERDKEVEGLKADVALLTSALGAKGAKVPVAAIPVASKA